MSEKLDRKHLRYMSEKFREISEAQMFQVLSKEKPEVGCCFFCRNLFEKTYFETYASRTDERGRT